MCFDVLYTLELQHFVFEEEMSEMRSKVHIGLRVTYQIFLSDFNESWIFSTVCRNILINEISWKFVQWVPCCSMRTDRRADMTKLIVVFRNFANALSLSSYAFHGVGSLVWPVPVSRVQKSLQRSTMIPSASWEVVLPWVICIEAFYLNVVSSFSCIPVIFPTLVLFLTPLQFVRLFCNP